MVYSKKFVAVVVCNNKILRERRDTNSSEDSVSLPFNSDYSIRLKNLESRKAVVSVQIDGQDVLNGNQIIVNGNDTIDLKGFMEGMTVKNAFRFIKKTQEIVEHRGDKIDDGFIRIEWQWEKQKIVEDIIHEHHHHNHYNDWDYDWYNPWWTRPYRYAPHGPYWTSGEITYGGSSIGQGTFGQKEHKTSNDSILRGSNIGGSSCSNNVNETPLMRSSLQENNINDDEGITVKGAQTNQNWHTAYIGELEEVKNTIVIRLTGTERTKHQVKPIKKILEEFDNDYEERKFRDFKERKIQEEKTKPVKEPLYVRSKIKCSTCGRSNRSGNKYCFNCGTFLGA